MLHTADTALLVVLGSSSLIMLVGIVRCFNHYLSCKRDLGERVKTLRLDRMLNHLGTTRSRYLRKTKPLTIEKHLLACARCNATEICDECLEQGKNIPEYTFCPNYPEILLNR